MQSVATRVVVVCLNYNVELTEGSDRVHVDFSLRPFKGDLSEGGGRQYVLNETTGEILEHTRDK